MLALLASAVAAVASAPTTQPTTSAAERDGLPAIRREARSLGPLVKSDLVRHFLAATEDLPRIAPRTIYRDEATRTYYNEAQRGRLTADLRDRLTIRRVDEELYYKTKYGTPVAYARPLDILADAGLSDVAGKRVLDFGYGGIGHLRLLASLGADVTGVDVDSLLPALYCEPADQGAVPNRWGKPGRLRLLSGQFPADRAVTDAVGEGYDLVISKNTLKNGYLHPARPVDPRMLVHLGVGDEAFVQALHRILRPGGRVLIYNLCPAPAPADKPYIPWADGRCPFPRAMWQSAGFRVVAFDKNDDDDARAMGRALGWDRGEDAMDLDQGLFALYTLVEKAHAPAYRLAADAAPPERWPAAEAKILTNVRQLTNPAMGLAQACEAYFSPDLRRIIFQAYPRGQSKYQMFTLELAADGTAQPATLKQVSPGGGACTCGWFKPDGSGILFASSYLHPDLPNPNFYHRAGSSYTWDMPGGMDLIEAGLDGSHPRPLTTAVGYDAEGSSSPDGKTIVFTSDRGGNPDIYVMNADGKNVRQLTHAPGYDGGPFFSPDGRRIIFRSDRRGDDHLQLFVMNADGSGERQLTAHSDVVNWAPYWLPDGRSVLFTTSLHGHYNYEVYLLNIETGRHQRVTSSPGFDGLPVISRDGRWMMWTSKRGPDHTSQIFLADFHAPTGF